MATTLSVVTYEGMLIGWEAAAGPDGLTLELAYAFKAHAGAIQTLLAAGNILLCGCADGAVEVFDMKSKVNVGQLLEHKAGVTAMAAYGGHMLSGDALGALCVWRTSDWMPLTKLKGHTKAVSSISVHPSGRMAISVGEDGMLFLWDLVKGRAAHSQKLGKPARQVRWLALPGKGGAGGSAGPAVSAETGYELVYDDEVVLHDSNGVQMASAALPGSRIRCTVTLPAASAHPAGAGKASSSSSSPSAPGLTVVAGLEGGAVTAVPLTSGKTAAGSAAGGSAAAAAAAQLSVHDKRVRCATALNLTAGGHADFIATAGGEGLVKLWQGSTLLASLSAASSKGSSSSSAATPEPVAVLTAAKGFRITDMAVTVTQGKGKKQQQKQPKESAGVGAGAGAGQKRARHAADEDDEADAEALEQVEDEEDGAAAEAPAAKHGSGGAHKQKTKDKKGKDKAAGGGAAPGSAAAGGGAGGGGSSAGGKPGKGSFTVKMKKRRGERE